MPRYLTPGDRTNCAAQEGARTWERWRERCHVPRGRPKFGHATKSEETVGTLVKTSAIRDDKVPFCGVLAYTETAAKAD